MVIIRSSDCNVSIVFLFTFEISKIKRISPVLWIILLDLTVNSGVFRLCRLEKRIAEAVEFGQVPQQFTFHLALSRPWKGLCEKNNYPGWSIFDSPGAGERSPGKITRTWNTSSPSRLAE